MAASSRSSPARAFSGWRAAFDEAAASAPLFNLFLPRWRIVRIDAATLRSGALPEARREPGRPVVARLASELGLNLPLKLPLAARSDLGSAAQLALETTSPIALNFACSAVDLASARSDGDSITLNASIAERGTVEAATTLAQGVAGRVDAVDVERPGAASASPRIDLRTGGPAMRPGATPSLAVLAMSAAALVVGVAGLGIAAWREQAQGAQIGARGSPVTRAALELASRRRASPPVLDSVEALSAALPSSAFLESIEISGASIKISGRAMDAARLPGALEETPEFSDVSLSGPTRGLDSGQQAFEITLQRGGAR